MCVERHLPTLRRTIQNEKGEFNLCLTFCEAINVEKYSSQYDSMAGYVWQINAT